MISWNRSIDGFIASKCECYTISPLYWGCVKPQGYEVHYKEMPDSKQILVKTGCDKQLDAKIAADHYARVLKK